MADDVATMLDAIDMPEIGGTAQRAIGTPAGNMLRLYAADNNALTKLYAKDSAGTVIGLTEVRCDTVEITNAEIKALRASPKLLVAAPGAGNFLQFLGAVLILDYGTNVLTESTDNLVIQYHTSGTDASAAIETTGWIDQAADQMAFIIPATIATVTAANIVNLGLELFNTGDGEIAGNAALDTTMTVKITYAIHYAGL